MGGLAGLGGFERHQCGLGLYRARGVGVRVFLGRVSLGKSFFFCFLAFLSVFIGLLVGIGGEGRCLWEMVCFFLGALLEHFCRTLLQALRLDPKGHQDHPKCLFQECFLAVASGSPKILLKRLSMNLTC